MCVFRNLSTPYPKFGKKPQGHFYCALWFFGKRLILIKIKQNLPPARNKDFNCDVYFETKHFPKFKAFHESFLTLPYTIVQRKFSPHNNYKR
jgi:hypothetical protein